MSRQSLLLSSTLEAQYEGQIRQAREQLAVKMREMEEGWRRQMGVSQGLITKLEEEKKVMLSNAAVNAAQVRERETERGRGRRRGRRPSNPTGSTFFTFCSHRSVSSCWRCKH